MEPLRIKPSDEDYPLINMLSYMISVYKNPQLFWDIKDMSETERLAEVSTLETMLEELLH